ncbi:YadA-like family protein [Bartonella bovis]|uniref:Surface protein/Bartonella adhesin n=1 Tax=Bartonella bovis m02 TaxID=1094492 RepID=N6VJ64_9HYPH|nr:YadA-like family protein [Bartonella bovis]ENN93266.1 surface protein/Bartonella adhesin [Bartonella bovis m02]
MQDGGSKLITIGKDVDGDEISLVNKDAEVRVLSGVAEGDLSKDSTDAVTGKQLYKTTQTVTGLTSTVSGVEKNITDFDAHLSMYLGGGADVLKGTAPTYTIQDKKHNNIASAFEGVDSSLEDLSAKVDDATGKRLARAEGNQLVVQDGGSKLITIGKDVDGDEISLVNKDAGVRVLSGVAEGDLSKDSTDAVTGKQLYKTTQTVTGLTSTVSGVEKNITDFDAHLSMYLGGGADVLKGTAPTYTIQDKKHNNIASAFEGVDSSLEDLSARVDDATAQRLARAEDNQLVVQDGGSKLITIGKDVDGDEISLVNKDAEVRVLSGVAEGDLSKDSTDAVTGKQLYKTTQTVTGLTSTVSGVEKNITDFDTHLSMYLGGGADVLKGTAPTYTIQDKKHNNIASAFEGVDSSLEDLSARVDDATAQRLARAEDNQLVVQDGGSKLITIGKDVDGDEISLVNKDAEVRVLSGVAEGDLSKDSTDAVTGKQLYETNTTIAKYFGGGAEYNGQWQEPTFTITSFDAQGKSGEQQYHNVADAFGAVNSSMSGLNDRIEQIEQQTGSPANSNSLNWNNDKNAYDASHNGQPGKITNVANGAIAQGSTDAVTGDQLWATNDKIDNLEGKVNGLTDGIVTYDKDADGNKMNSVTLVGTGDDTPVIIDNVADGKIEEGSKQAINGGQLHDYTKEQMDLVLADANKYTDEKIQNIKNAENIPTDIIIQANAYTDMKFNALNSEIKNAQKEARQAAAISLAVSNLRYNDTPGKLSVAFGSGVWRGQSAIAFGSGYTSENGDIHSNLSITTTGGHWGIGAGLSLMLK